MATLILKDDIPHEQVGEIMRKLGLALEVLSDDPSELPMTDSLFGSNGDGTFGSWLPAGEQRKESGEE